MKNAIEFTLADGQAVLMEVDGLARPVNRDEEYRGMEDVVAKAGETLESALGRVRRVADSIVSSLKSVAANECEVEFGIKFSAKTGIIITSADAEATLKISLKWVTPKGA